jgi:hypothetical protein
MASCRSSWTTDIRNAEIAASFLAASGYHSGHCDSSVRIGVGMDDERPRETFQLLEKILSHCSPLASILVKPVY